jgi:hypothetical protein
VAFAERLLQGLLASELLNNPSSRFFRSAPFSESHIKKDMTADPIPLVGAKLFWAAICQYECHLHSVTSNEPITAEALIQCSQEMY